jgi:preprotein translocase subunit SecY
VLTAVLRAFRTPDLRKKLMITFGLLALYRLGCAVQSPGIDTQAVHDCVSQASNTGVTQIINLFSGGALLQLSLFALGIMPYITASIIIQLLGVVIPRLETLRKEGQAGEAKLTQYTRYLTIALAVLQSTGIVALARSGRLIQGCSGDSIIPDQSVFAIAVLVIALTAGTGVVMWLGELITNKGIGNGMSLLIFTSIASRIPAEGNSILQGSGGFVFTLILILGIGIVAAVVFVQQADRRIPVQYAKRVVGRRVLGGSSTYIPLKINQAGVIPVIFAASLLQVPALLDQVWNNGEFDRIYQRFFARGDHPLYVLVYFVLIMFFTYFYVAITFNPTEQADNMKKYGGFIPGIRPGRPTAEFLDFVLSRITLPGAIFLGAVSVLPIIALGVTNGAQFPFGGTTVLILVGVGLEFVKQVESQLLLRNYEGFLR